MYCPSCGSKNSTDQRFCRACGMNLESTASSLREQYPDSERYELTKREQRLERFGQFAFGGFGIVLLIAIGGLIYTIFTKMVLTGQQPLAGILLSAFIVFAALTLAYVVFAEDLKDKRKRGRAEAIGGPDELRSPAVTGRLLEEREFVPAASVTENTTDLLPVADRERR